MRIAAIVRGTFLATLLATLLAACSATDFKPPIAAFDDAVGEGVRLVDAYSRERAEANFALRRAALAQRPDPIMLRGADCRPGARPEACTLRMGAGRVPVGAPTPAVRPAELAGALAAYAASLAAVAAAETEAEFDTNAQKLTDSLRGLAGTLPGRTAESAGVLVDPAGALFGALAGLALQQRRFTLLRNAINAADAAVQDAATELAALTGGQHDAAADDRAALIARLAALYNALDTGGGLAGSSAAVQRETLLTRIAALQDQQRRLLADDPAAELRKLGQAHAALRQGVNDPTPPVALLTDQIKRLSDRLRRAADAVQRLNVS